MTHELKIAPIYFEDVVNGNKKFEIRKNDRDFKVRDRLILKEYFGNEYTGREVKVFVTYILSANEFPDGIKSGYVVMGIELLVMNF